MAKSVGQLRDNKLYLISIVACCIDLLYLPNLADPLNPIKFWILGISTLFLVANLIFNLKIIQAEISDKKVFKSILAVFLIYLTSLLNAFFFTDVKSIGLIGFHGRNTGLLFYFFLSVIFLYSSLKFRFNNLKYFYISLMFLTSIFAIYGTCQHFNIDFIQWNAPFNKIVLMVGNPDFSAALLAILIATIFPVMFIDIRMPKRIGLGILISIVVLVIYWTNARQGLIGLAAGLSFILLVLLWQKNKAFAIGFLVADLLMGLIAVLGTLQVGPLTKYLYKSSVNDRGYDWQAAWHMFMAHPWTGVGIDRYAGSFFRYQDSKYPLIYGNTQLVNNAHSVYLQFFATGGVALGFAYIALTTFVGLRAFKVIKRYKNQEQILVAGVIAGWIVFVAQSLISVDNLSVTIWGWLLGGIIIGLSYHVDFIEVPGQLKRKLSQANLFNMYACSIILIFVFTIAIILPMYKGETRVVNFLRINPSSVIGASLKSEYMQLGSQAFNTPLLSPDYKVRIAFNITNAGLVDEGKLYFEQILKQDPKKSDAPQFLAEIYESQKNYPEAIKYRVATREVYPWNTANLFGLESDYLAIGDKNSAKAVRDSIIAMAPGTENALKADKAIGG